MCKAITKQGNNCKKPSGNNPYCSIHKHIEIEEIKNKKITCQRDTLKNLNKKAQELSSMKKQSKQLLQQNQELIEQTQKQQAEIKELQHNVNELRQIKDTINKYEAYNCYIKHLHTLCYGNTYNWSIYNLQHNSVADKIVNHQLHKNMNLFIQQYEKIRVNRNSICHPRCEEKINEIIHQLL